MIQSKFKQLIAASFMVLMTALLSYGQQIKSAGIDTGWKNYINLKNYLEPFWKADTIYDEISLVIKDKDTAQGTLLFNANQILSVRAANYSREFVRGKDWSYENGKITINPGSAIPFIAKEDLVYTTDKPGMSMTGKAAGSFVLFSESNFFRSKQIAVTYIPAQPKTWNGPIPRFAKSSLYHTLSRLKNKVGIKIVFYGNSIETGSNSSGFQNDPPYMPSWPQLIIYNLRQAYGDQINFSNRSEGGKLAQWGMDNVNERVMAENPDLVIIGFGMNDGSAKISPDNYMKNITGIMDPILAQNPDAEFILIAPMLPNPDAVQSGIQASYFKELNKLARKGVIVANLTDVHQELLNHKNYQDMTGNNVNHPNDYLARWYAQYISGLLIK